MNLNTKQNKTNLGRLISDITNHYDLARKHYLKPGNDDHESEDYFFSKLCFYSYRKNQIRLYEDFGISYYSVKSTMQEIMAKKNEIHKKHDQAFEDWQKAKEKAKAAA